LRKRIQILLGVLVGIPLILLLWESYRAGRTTFLRQLKLESLQIAKLEEEGIELIFSPPRLLAEAVARSVMVGGSLREDEIRELLRRTLRESPQLYGTGVFLEPDQTPLGRFAPYVFRRNGRETEITIPYEYTQSPWYRLPVEGGRGLWSKPYFDEGGGGALMVTHAAPIRREGRIVGVATVDLDLDGLVARMRRIRPGGGGSAYLASRKGRILAHPDLKAIAEVDTRRLEKLIVLMNAKGDDMAEMVDPVSGKNSWIVEAPIDSLSEAHGAEGWSLIVSWPLDARLAPLGGLARRMLVLYLFLGGAALLFLNRSFDQVVSRPLRRLAEQARRYARGDYTRQPPADEEAAELQELSQALESLGESLGKQDRPPTPP
jgi:sigma-B regulation protein RsbU (phosphoserine phosphatase)